MQDLELFFLFTDPIEKTGLRYMVSGSVAGSLYGEPRLTHDIDLILELEFNDYNLIRKAFSSSEFYVPPDEVMAAEISRSTRGHFNLIHSKSGFKADIYVARGDALHAWGLDNRTKIVVANNFMFVAPPEYVILRKLEYFKEGNSQKHLSDIAAIHRHSNDEIDEKVICNWANKMGTLDIYKNALALK